jgi:predicted Zn-dependent peptidase
MHRLGRSELTLGEILSLDELVEEVTKVEAADVSRTIERVLGSPERALAVVGPVESSDFEDAVQGATL